MKRSSGSLLTAERISGDIVSVDFYDGCMIYDFVSDRLHLCDFDLYMKMTVYPGNG